MWTNVYNLVPYSYSILHNWLLWYVRSTVYSMVKTNLFLQIILGGPNSSDAMYADFLSVKIILLNLQESLSQNHEPPCKTI